LFLREKKCLTKEKWWKNIFLKIIQEESFFIHKTSSLTQTLYTTFGKLYKFIHPVREKHNNISRKIKQLSY